MEEQTRVAHQCSLSRFIWSLYDVIKLLSSPHSYKHLVFGFLFVTADSRWGGALEGTNYCLFWISEYNNSEPIAVLCC